MNKPFFKRKVITIKQGIKLSEVKNIELPGHINPDFLCNYCDLFINGAHFCKKCKFYFCQSCVLLRMKGVCPGCKGKNIISQIPRQKFKELSFYTFTCPNKKHGCHMELYYEVYEDHLDLCPFEQML